VLALAGALVAGAALAAARPGGDAAAELPGTSSVPPEVRAAVPLVRSAGCGWPVQGSGVVVARNGVPRLVTNAHVVAGEEAVSVDGVRAPVLAVSRGRDVAVLAPPPGVVPLETGPAPERGAAVRVLGHPGGRFDATEGRVVASSRRSGPGGAADVLLLDVPVRGGSSGGAVLDVSDRVVGIVVARDPASGGAVAYPVDAAVDLGTATTLERC
jgi:S1-C subfamily serine protease